MRIYKAKSGDPVPHKVIWRHPSKRGTKVGVTRGGNELVFINKVGVFLLPISSLAACVERLPVPQ